MTPTHDVAGGGSPVGALGGLILGVVAYLLFTWAMASGLMPVPSKVAQRRGALALLVIAVGMLAAQLALVVWSQLER